MRKMPISSLSSRGIALLLSFGATVLLPLAGQAEELSPAQKGAELATQQCARCHAVQRTGDSPMAEAPPFRTFASKWPLESLEEAFAEGIVVGHPAMPEFVFEPEEIRNLLSHMDAISR